MPKVINEESARNAESDFPSSVPAVACAHEGHELRLLWELLYSRKGPIMQQPHAAESLVHG